MKILPIAPARQFTPLAFALGLLATAGAPALASAQTSPSLPPGITAFAGRLARYHWYVLGPEKRAELELLNRELRENQQQIQTAPDEKARSVAAEQAGTAANRLREEVLHCPRLLRIELSDRRAVLSPAGPVEVPGDTGALLLEISSPGEGLQFSNGTADLSEPPGESSLVAVESAPAGVTYAIVGLEHVPRGRTTLMLEFRRRGKPAVRVPLQAQVPQPGRLKLTVLSAEAGKPVPAMVRLMWRTDGRQRQPGNGIEFAAQFDKQGTASGARAANLPGAMGGQFWCVPGPVDMMLAPGIWQIGVRRGVEHKLVFEDVTIRSGETAEKTIRPARWVDMRRRGWWSGDDHVHCRIVSEQDARQLMWWAQAEDVHLINVVKMGDIYRTYFDQRGFGPRYRVRDGQFVLVPGQECPRTHNQLGHALAMNITDMVRETERYYLYDEVFDAVHAQGGLTGYAHVNTGLFHVHRDMSLNVPRQKLDFVEILQFNQLGTGLYYDFLNLGCKLTASAGSDVPWGGTIGEVRAYVYLGRGSFDADRWFEAFQRGHTFTTSGPMIEFKVDNALPGDELRVNADRPLRVRARAWGDPQHMAPITLEIVRQGEVVQSAESTDPNRPETELDFKIQSGDGCWVAARARGGDGTSAHTTPVYVIRKGLRFWKYDKLDELIGKRLASLAEIEQIVAEARRLDSEGKLETDRYREQLALQGDLLLERVAAARKVYDALKRVADAERTQRKRQ